jgi:hypothetical protein
VLGATEATKNLLLIPFSFTDPSFPISFCLQGMTLETTDFFSSFSPPILFRKKIISRLSQLINLKTMFSPLKTIRYPKHPLDNFYKLPFADSHGYIVQSQKTAVIRDLLMRIRWYAATGGKTICKAGFEIIPLSFFVDLRFYPLFLCLPSFISV